MLSQSLVRCAVGPYGSGKSMACIMELLRKAREQRPHEGVRYTRFAVVRNTLQQLRATVLSDIQQYIGPMVRYFVTDSTVQIRVGLPDGTSLHSDWMLIPLDTKEDQRRLLSLQLTGSWVNELREVPVEIMDPLIGRCGRYPSSALGGYTWRGVIADTNPWDVDSPYHEIMVLKPDPRYELFHQPSAIGPDAENLENLPPTYYQDMIGTRGEDWSGVHVESMWGSSNAGQAVFRRSFHAPDHVRELDIKAINPMRPLMIGMDFGRTPCALIGQVDNYGRLLVLQEITSEDMGLYAMVEEKLKPALQEGVLMGKKFFVVADPAGMFKGQLTDDTPFQALRSMGFLAYPASTNDIDPRLRAVEKMLRTRIMGEAGLQISRSGCPTLVRAMGARYRYRKKRDGELEDLPEKNHPWSDVADALQYMCLGMNQNLTGRVMMRDRPRTAGPRVSSAGWT